MYNRKCELCGGSTTDYMDRCNNCHKCDDCGVTENLIYGEDGLYCRPHYEKIIDKAVEDFDGDTSYTDLITCPYCGSENGDSWETRESGDTTCSRCDNEFYVEVDVTVTYSTSKCEPASRLPFAREG